MDVAIRCETCGGPLVQEEGLSLSCPRCLLSLAMTGEATGRYDAGSRLEPGTMIGRYRIVRLIGDGGMGTVYEAEQESPQRTVALKLIKPEFTSLELLRRFEQESRALGRLQHPGIAQIYEAGAADTGHGPQPYLAMEFIHGQSIREYADQHHLSARDRLALVARVCDAVHHAHQRGLIHRDLKPANILVDEVGQPKILDFGVARVTDGDMQTTLSTGIGQLVGTLEYMSPEQVFDDPLELDTRSDVYTLGVICYELLANRMPYSTGKTVLEAAHTIREADPARLSMVNRSYRGDIETIAARALEKDKTRRYSSAAELAADIRRYLNDEPIVARPPSASYQLRKFARRNKALVIGIVAVLVALVAGAAIATLLVLRFAKAPEEVRKQLILATWQALSLESVRLTIDAPAGTLFSGAPADLNVSPDGHYVVFGALGKDGNQSLWLRPIDSFETRRLDGTANAFSPFWSPDSKQIAFFKEGKLVRLVVATGEVHPICDDVPDGRGGTWNEDDVIVFARNLTGPLYRVSARRSEAASPLPSLNKDQDGSGHIWPQFLPDNDHFVYLAWSEQKDKRHIRMDSLSAPASQVILNADSNITFALGHLIFSQNGKLLAQPFDPSAGKTTGDAFVLSEDVWRNPATGRAAFAASQSGVLVYRNGTNFGATQLVIRDRRGAEGLGSPTGGGYGNPLVSPDGKRIALDVQDYKEETRSIWTMTLDDGVLQRVTSRASTDSSPLFSADSRQILFLSNLDRPAVYRIGLERFGATPEKVFQEDGILNIQDWSEPQQSIIFEKLDPLTKRDLWRYSLKDRKAFPFLHDAHNEIHGQVSPDGKWIVYASDETNQYEVYLQKFPEGGRKQSISAGGGGIQPKWNPNGKEVFYLAPDRGLMAVAIDSDSGARKGKPERLFQTDVNGPNALHARNNYSVLGRQGETFVINSVADSKQPINVILGWKPR